MKVDARIQRPVNDRIDTGLVEPGNHFPHAAAPAERHGAKAQLGDEHTRISQLSVLHGRIISD
jgi:hypothetical protein